MTDRGWDMNDGGFGDGGFGECIGFVSDDCSVICPAHLLISHEAPHLLLD